MSTPKLDRRVQKTRQQLQSALTELILEKGYDAISVQDITDRADVGRSTFYLHYRDKDDMLMSNLEEVFAQLTRQIDNFIAEPEQGHPEVGLIVFQHAQEYYKLYRIMVSEQSINFFNKRLREHLAGIARHQIEQIVPRGQSPAIPLEIVAQHIAGSLLTLLVWWLDNKMPYPPEYMSDVFHRLTIAVLTSVLEVPLFSVPTMPHQSGESRDHGKSVK
jgi:AcrR family transcriptional regulator